MKGNFPGQKKKRALKKKRQINPLERALNAFERASIKYPNSWGRGGNMSIDKMTFGNTKRE